ncbi:twin-arginine translocase subunit TatC [Candidatus Obscuribacterales bacterium]|nr:twin-arginine translocase subunit TatC [Candidatus Obscuribacterales bacterium]
MSTDGDQAAKQPNDYAVGDISQESDELDLSPQPVAEKHDIAPRELAEQAEGGSPILVGDDDSVSGESSNPIVTVQEQDEDSDSEERSNSIITIDEDDDSEAIVQDGEDDQIFEDDEDGDSGPGSMTLVEHLGELRDRLARCLAYVAVSFGVALYFGKRIIEFLEKPAGGMKFQALSIEEPLIVFFKVTFYAALVIASPFILFEVSRFIAPGLTRREKQIVTPALVGGPILFVCGAAFAYYLLLPQMFHFFNSFGMGIAPIHQRLDFYMSLVASILLYMGLCFQLPIVIFALSFTGLVTSNQLIKVWRYAVFGASCVALIITPDPTAFSMLIVMGALVGLYAISVVILKIFGR